MNKKTQYDAVIIGGGHNGLVAACYLGMAGKKVLILEKNDYIGGASTSQKVFPDYEAYLSRYSYLVSLFPNQIFTELGLTIPLLRRSIASYTPNGEGQGILLSNENEDITKQNIQKLGTHEWKGYQNLLKKQTLFAELIWDSFLQPLQSKADWEKVFKAKKQAKLWRDFVEKPIGELIESHFEADILRGIIFTDGKIGANTYAHDPSLLQNRTFIYHIIGNKTGEWRVPQGGMGNLAKQLADKAKSVGVEWVLNAKVIHGDYQNDISTISYENEGNTVDVKTKYVLWNAAPPFQNIPDKTGVNEGTAFKINMLLTKLPLLKDKSVTSEQAFAGTFHIDEGYAQMQKTYDTAHIGRISDTLAGEIYCHTLTDNSILSEKLQREKYHTLTYFGLDLPYTLFEKNNEQAKKEVVSKFLKGINHYLETPLEDCLALDKNGDFCLEAKSSLDLEKELGLPRGNIFQKSLTWFFAENEEEIGSFGVETEYPNVFICGSSAKRGGAVSGIAGRNAAMAILKKPVLSTFISEY
jgi:phytoene dehydrogenase-like protein